MGLTTRGGKVMEERKEQKRMRFIEGEIRICMPEEEEKGMGKREKQGGEK